MNKLHVKFHNSLAWYRNWHHTSKYSLVHWVSILGIALFAGNFIVSNIQKTYTFEVPKAEAAVVIPQNSPLALKQHPRLHITPATLAAFRSKVAGPNKAAYQALVTKVVNSFELTTIHDDVGSGLASDYHALIYLLGEVPGIDYGGKTLDQFGARAVEILLDFVATTPLDCDGVNSSKVENFHGGGDNYPTMARAYDWIFNYPGFTNAQKQTVANRLAQAGLCIAGPRLFSSSYHEQYRFPWYIGLAVHGDGFVDSDAALIVNKFEQHMLNGGPLDAMNFAAQNHGGPSEITAYAYGNHGGRDVVYLDGWRTATGIDYFVQGTSVANASYHRYYAKFYAYILSPWNSGKYLKWGQMSVNDCARCDAWLHVNMLTGILKNSDPDMASLARWASGGGDFSTSAEAASLLRSIVLGDSGVVPKSPAQLGLPLTQYFAGLGMVFARSGFEDPNDLALVIGGPPYRYEGHTWDKISDIPIGFQIDKYGGPLIFKKVYYHRNNAGAHRQNVMRFNDPATLTTETTGGIKSLSLEGSDIRVLNPNHGAYTGGVERYMPLANGRLDYVYTDLTRNYVSSRVSNYTRQYVLSRPASKEQSDYLIIFDRTETSTPEIIKRWQYNIAYDPIINGTATPVRNGLVTYANANQVTVSNNQADPYYSRTPAINANAHGRAFVKTLLPKQVKIDKYGGIGYEFQLDTGVVTSPEDSDNYLRDYGAFYVGAYTIDVIPTQNNSKENFLHVIQTADANTTNTMISTSLIESTEGKMQGVFVNKTTGQDNTVAMFATNEEALDLSSQAVTYKYGAGSTGTTKHIVSDLKANTTYTITDKNIASGATTTQTIVAPDLRTDFAKIAGQLVAGSITFNTNISGEHQITIVQQGSSVNFPPSVTFSTNKFSALPPGGFVLTALASDQDGSVTKVEFYNGASLIGTDNVSPYTMNWSNVPAGNYTLTAKAYDNTGASSVSNAVSIVVGFSADITPPDVMVTSPGNNSIIGPSPITITVSATDALGVNSVDFKFDGALIGNDATSPYSLTWTPPSGTSLGNHIITAEAMDAAGNKGISGNTTVLFSPTGTNRLPIGNLDGITTTAKVKGWTFDPDNSSALSTIQLYIGGPIGVGTIFMNRGTNINSPDVNATYNIAGSHRFEQDIPVAFKNGQPHAIHAYGFDLNDPTKYVELTGSPKVYDSSAVDTTPPTVSISAPANGATLTGTVSLTANASDNQSIAGVQFKLNGANLGSEDTAAPYTYSWNTSSTSNGSKTLTAVARDTSGNTTTSNPITVTTSNTTVTPPPPSPSPTPTTNALPIGNFDEITSGGLIRGWSLDPNNKTTANTVHIYVNGPAGTGTLLTGFSTNALRTDVNTAQNTTGNHGFEYNIPNTYRDGKPHSVYVYGIDINDTSKSTLLTGSPKSFTISTLADVTAPLISNIVISNITANSVTVTYTTNEPAYAYLEFRNTCPGTCNTPLTTSLTTNQSITVNTLTGSTDYLFQAKARDQFGNLSSSSNRSFTTLAGSATPPPPPPAPSPDVTLPNVSITAPASGSTVSGSSVAISANASDNVSVAGVQFKVDGVNLGSEDTQAPYTTTWNPTGLSGTHVITAVARDTAGNTKTSSSVSVTVSSVVVPPPAPSAPVISDVSVTVRQGTASISWKTNIPATSLVEYGATSSYGSTSVVNSTLNTTHVRTISNLNPGTYNFRAVSAANNVTGTSGNSSFTVRSKPPRISVPITVRAGSIILEWTNPSFDGFAGVAILRSSSSFINTYDEMYEIATTASNTYTDTNVVSGTTYYYSLYIYDDQFNYSDPATVSFIAPVVVNPTPEPTPPPPVIPPPVPTPVPTPQPTPTPPVTETRHPRGSIVDIDGTIYFLGTDLKYPFPSLEVMYSWGVTQDQIVPANDYDKAMPTGPVVELKSGGATPPPIPVDGILIKDQTPAIYIMEYGKKRPFANWESFQGLGFNPALIQTIQVSHIPTGDGIFTPDQRHTRGTLIVLDGTVYYLGAEIKYAFPSAEVFHSWGRSFQEVVQGNNHDRLIPDGPIVEMRQ